MCHLDDPSLHGLQFGGSVWVQKTKELNVGQLQIWMATKIMQNEKNFPTSQANLLTFDLFSHVLKIPKFIQSFLLLW